MVLARQYSGGANGNRSLERGIEILRAFRPGVDTLGNGEIAERTGLPRSTVSRLTKTLVAFGMLDEIRAERNYRLAAAVLSFGHAVRMGSPALRVLGPLMRTESTRRKLNVGLATADRAMMVYLESIRYNSRPTLRSIVAGQQVPMELTSLGRAYLAGIPDGERDRLIGHPDSHRPALRHHAHVHLDGGPKHQRQRPWPERGGQTFRQRRHRRPCADLTDVGGDEGNRLVERAPLEGEQLRHGAGVGGVDSETIQRVSGIRDHQAAPHRGDRNLHRRVPVTGHPHSRHLRSRSLTETHPLPDDGSTRGEEENARPHAEAASRPAPPPDGRTSRGQDPAAVARA